MKIDPFLFGLKRPVFAPADEGGDGGGAADGGAGGDGGAADGGSGGEDKAADGGDGGSSNWWEGDRYTEEQRQTLVAAGLTKDDKDDVIASLVDMERAAQRRLGAKPDTLFAKPGEGQTVADWRKANAETFQIPEAPDGYSIDQPESWPEGVKWDTELEGKARQLAHERGWSNDDLQAVTDFYAELQAGMIGGVQDELKNSSAAMREELTAEWGDQYQANETRAKQAASFMAEQLGFDETAMQQMIGALSKNTGDANTMRLFAKVGELMGEDNLTMGGQPGGFATTPAEARAELAKLRGPDGEYAKAVASKNKAKLEELAPKIARLDKIVAGASN